jgi:hypothetical protein
MRYRKAPTAVVRFRPSVPRAKRTASSDPEKIEARARLRKLLLEQAALRRSLSISALMLEWLKAAAVPVAVLSLLATFG